MIFWKRVSGTGEMGIAISFNIIGWISSSPAALAMFRSFNNLHTSSAVTCLSGIVGKARFHDMGSDLSSLWRNFP